MKIGILTFHNGINHGAFLQVYALQQFLIENGFNVEVINYQSKAHRKAERNYFLFFKPLFSLNPRYMYSISKRRVQNFLKIYKFKEAQKLLRLTKRIDDIGNLKTEKYDFVITGSDEIWNLNNPLFLMDRTYFGLGIKSKAIISYAVSFGNTEVNDPKIQTVKDLLNKFRNISIRDYNSNIILKSINIESDLVLDPTFLWQSYKIKPVIISNYLLVYLNQLRKENISHIRKFAKKNNLKLVSISYDYQWADYSDISIDPFEWISYFRYASFVITNTYHGAIFSILSKKNFIVTDIASKSNKISSLLNELELDYLIKKDLSDLKHPSINYEYVFSILEKKKEFSMNYLINSLKK